MSLQTFKILVTDGGSVNSLAVVRHLGKLGYPIIIVSYNKLAISAWSRYCQKSFVIAHPRSNPSAFSEALISIIEGEKIDFLMPVGFYAHKAIINQQSQFDLIVSTCLPQLNAFELATSKIKTAERASLAGVLVPKTILPKSPEDLKSADSLKFPLVIKAQKEIGGRMVEYANNPEELKTKFEHLINQNQLSVNDYPLVQEYINGEGVGYFAFYINGKCIADFMHERIREFPVSGGRSVCARSFEDPSLRAAGRAVLESLNWNGCAMVEFKRTKENQYYLLEVNPKLWGSLELAICAGVNFPQLMVTHTFDPNFKNELTFKKNIYFQWLLNGELYHFVNRPISIFSIIKTMLHSYKDFWWTDLKPNIVQLTLIPIDFYKAIKTKLFG